MAVLEKDFTICDFILTDQQEKFCLEYTLDPKSNASAAAVRAGYAEGSARITASRLLTRANIKSRIRELRREALERSGYDKENIREMIMRRLTGIVSTHVTDVIQVSPDINDPNRKQILDELASLHDGQNMIDFGDVLVAPTSNMTEAVSGSLKSLSIKPIAKSNDVSVEVDMHDPIAAARLLAEITGLKQADTVVNISLAERLERGRRRVIDAGHSA